MTWLRSFAPGLCTLSMACLLACQTGVTQGQATSNLPSTDGGDVPDSGTQSRVVDAGAEDAGSHSFAGATPEDPGPYDVEQETLTIEVGEASSRVSIELTIVSPSDVTRAPVVLFHPGFQLPATSYLSYGEHLASHGFLVILVDPPDGLFGGPSHSQMASYLGDVLEWLHIQNENERFSFVVDESKIGLAGHSMGGKLSLLFASQDERPVAVAGIDPVDAAGGPFSEPDEDNPSVTPERMSQIGVPLLLVGETLNGTCDGLFCQPCAPADDNFQQYFEHATSPTLEIEVLGANHMSFLDDPNCGFACSVCTAGTDDPAITRRLTQRYLNAFFQFHLFEVSAARTWLVGEKMEEDIQANRVQTRTKNGY